MKPKLMVVLMKSLPLFLASLLLATAVHAQVILQPGQTALCAPTVPTSTQTGTPVPTATTAPTPVPTPTSGGFISGSFNLPTCSNPYRTDCQTLYPGQSNSQYISWGVQPFDSNGFPTVVAAVDVFQNSTRLANIVIPSSSHTFIYRLGGQPVGKTYANGVTILPIPAGTLPQTLQINFVAYDDNGNVMQTVQVPLQLVSP